MSSKIEIVNVALGYLGAQPVSDVDEKTEQAKRARLFYDMTRDSVLRSFPWAFALKQWNCPAVKAAPVFKDFKYGCSVANDCLRVLHAVDPNVRYERAGRYIYSDENPIDVIGIRRVDSEVEFDAVFSEVFALKLACNLSVVLADDKGLRDRLRNDYEMLIKTAQVKSALEGPAQEYRYESSWLNARTF